jgi:hypothetical protein
MFPDDFVGGDAKVQRGAGICFFGFDHAQSNSLII